MDVLQTKQPFLLSHHSPLLFCVPIIPFGFGWVQSKPSGLILPNHSKYYKILQTMLIAMVLGQKDNKIMESYKIKY